MKPDWVQMSEYHAAAAVGPAGRRPPAPAPDRVGAELLARLWMAEEPVTPGPELGMGYSR